MTEILRKINYNEEFDDKLRQTVIGISKTGKSIGNYYGIKKQGQELTGEATDALRFLHFLRKKQVTDLLILRQTNPSSVGLEYGQYKSEQIHPFSANSIFIYVPSVDKPGELWRVKAELSDIRGEGIAEDSLQAMGLVEDGTRLDEKVEAFLRRTALELTLIKYEKLDVISGNKNKYTLGELDDLSASIIEKRLLYLREKGQFNESSKLRIHLTDNGRSEGVMFRHEGKIYKFNHKPPRLENAVSKYNGYD